MADADDCAAMMQSVASLVDSATCRYDVAEIQPGNWKYCYIVEVLKEFEDKSVFHNIFLGFNQLSTIENALNSIIAYIGQWSSDHPGYPV